MASAGGGPPTYFAPIVLVYAAIVALLLGLLTGILPALAAYRLRINDALGRR
jgi:ABC-type antimicrobial peptide transport system permease subunit